MAFLDNSGDIILDAVLTDLGRTRMAQGTFNISRFGLGDDVIDYSQWVQATGSAYQDLTILQTPVFVAHTKAPNINYGLLDLARNDILYMPGIQTSNTSKVDSAVTEKSGIFYLAVNSETVEQLASSDGLSDKKYILVNNTLSGKMLIQEFGLKNSSNDGIVPTSTNVNNYLRTPGLYDSAARVRADNRFIGSVLSATPGSTFANTSNGAAAINITLTGLKGNVNVSSMANYASWAVPLIDNQVTYNAINSENNIIVTNGVVGSVGALNFSVFNELTSISTGTRSAYYTLYGATDVVGTDARLGFSGAQKWDFIDTTVYIYGESSTAMKQINLRIIRYASAS